MRTTYTAKQKTQALSLAREVGTAKAADTLGIPAGTIAQWRWRKRHAKTNGNGEASHLRTKGTKISPSTNPMTDKFLPSEAQSLFLIMLAAETIVESIKTLTTP